ncbi:hypothetical protein M413DRAFT_30926 [Hebeloma cylindrosporum]|uniref:Tet-like 2OG-Fe(II) oxygenase domain-containing protein n=1 Tax=Hebeloma cylindrosporum TaxID=76867 RepID=A0A0C3BL72_HEBCY|nr:hypothetical protein M413DRAFT_30926 [Hebeloma cylindrosporum h7]
MRDDFSNYQHQDEDEVAVVYELWWPALVDDAGEHYMLSESCSHERIRGGSFLLGEYGVGVELDKCHGLVEIAWRGSTDFHGTTLSFSDPGTTRFGTLVQITKKTPLSTHRWRSKGFSKRLGIITYHDQVKIAQKKYH